MLLLLLSLTGCPKPEATPEPDPPPAGWRVQTDARGFRYAWPGGEGDPASGEVDLPEAPGHKPRKLGPVTFTPKGDPAVDASGCHQVEGEATTTTATLGGTTFCVVEQSDAGMSHVFVQRWYTAAIADGHVTFPFGLQLTNPAVVEGCEDDQTKPECAAMRLHDDDLALFDAIAGTLSR